MLLEVNEISSRFWSQTKYGAAMQDHLNNPPLQKVTLASARAQIYIYNIYITYVYIKINTYTYIANQFALASGRKQGKRLSRIEPGFSLHESGDCRINFLAQGLSIVLHGLY